MGQTIEPDTRDLAFLDCIIEQDYNKYLEDRTAMIAGYFSKHPNQSKNTNFILRLNYTCVPMEKSLATHEDIVRELRARQGAGYQEGSLQEAEANHQSVFSILPSHGTPMCMITVYQAF